MYENGQLICTGTWFYNDKIKTGVAIQKMPIIYGSGDYEDFPEIRDDREIENYYIWFSTADSLTDFKNGAGFKLTLNEAKSEAENLVGQRIIWSDDPSNNQVLKSSV